MMQAYRSLDPTKILNRQELTLVLVDLEDAEGGDRLVLGKIWRSFV